MTDHDALLPCPFCGGAPRLAPYTSGRYFVACDNQSCETNPLSNGHPTKDEAIAAWNRLAHPAPAATGEEVHVRHVGGGLLALYRGDEQVREIGPTPGWNFRDRDEFIVRYNATTPAQQGGAVTEATTGRIYNLICSLNSGPFDAGFVRSELSAIYADLNPGGEGNG